MEASFVDLRTKSRQVVEALRRNESVTVTYRGKPLAVMRPIESADSATSTEPPASARDHPSFGIWADREDMADPAAWVRELRRPRFRGL